MSVLLQEYLRLEREMLRLDATAAGEGEADEIRDVMDVVWSRLSHEDRQLLNGRAIVLPALRPTISVRVGRDFISARPPVRPFERARAQRLAMAESDLWSRR
jgi:hypothetical protein